MASALDMRHLVLGTVAAFMTAALVWFGNGLFPIWPLMWFAALPALLFALYSRTWWGAALVAAIGWCFGDLHVAMFYLELGSPSTLLVLMAGAPATAFTLGVLLFRVFVRRDRIWLALFVFPSWWVSFEFVNSLVSPHGSYGSLAYTQLNFLPFLQLASLTGPWGMSFLLMMFSAAFALVLYKYRSQAREVRYIVITTASLLAAVLVFGAIRLALPASGQPVKVGLIASYPPTNGALTDKLIGDYAAEAATLVAGGAQVIVMPEKLGVIVGSNTQFLDARLQALADQTAVPIVIGLVHVQQLFKYNEARVYAPHSPVQTYHKEHLMPYFESELTPGTRLLSLHVPAGLWGVAICKDMDFRKPAQDYGKAGVGLMLVPAWDFIGDRWVHGHIAVMRGVEDGFGIVRAAKKGYLTVSDDRGRILAETTDYSAPFTTLTAEIHAAHDWTLYQVLGDWFGWVVIALLAVTVLLFVRRR